MRKNLTDGQVFLSIQLSIHHPPYGAGVAQSVYGLNTDWTTGVLFPEEAEGYSFSLCVQTSSEAHPASYLMGNRGPFPGGKERPGRVADRSLPSSAEVKNN
jgi:hypothetical protein